MSASNLIMRSLVAVSVIYGVTSWPASAQSSRSMDFGRRPTAEEIAGWNIDVTPNGAGLPAGHGTAAEGATIFATKCAACHGANGEGVSIPGRGGFPRLVGGKGTLADDRPVKTVGSYWPYPTGIFDYIRRAMPLTAPGSLSNNEVYSLVAFILARNEIIQEGAVMDQKTLINVKMPNRQGFFRSVESEKLTGPARNGD